MPVWLSLFLSILATGAFFGGLYLAICLAVAKNRKGAIPTLGVSSAVIPQAINVWVKWESNAFLIEFYRLRISHFSPERNPKEGSFSVTLDPTQKNSFLQPITLNQEFLDLLSDSSGANDSIVSVEAKTTDDKVISHAYPIRKLRAVFNGNVAGPKINALGVLTSDVPSVSTLDYQELVERRQKLKSLSDLAKEKERKTQAAAASLKQAAPSVAQDKPPVGATELAEGVNVPVAVAPPQEMVVPREDKPLTAKPSARQKVVT